MIVVHAKGNQQIGIGNLSRAYELVCYLAKQKNVIGIFECDKNLFEKYQKNNMFISNDTEQSLEIIKKYKCSLYICDLVTPDKNLSDALRNIGVKNIMYFNSLEYGFEPNILFVTDGFDYPVNIPHIDIYRGFQYYIIGEKIVRARKKYKTLNGIKNILISFGGADPAFYTEYFVKTIQDKHNNYTIVLGPAMPLERKKYIQSIRKNNIKYIDSPPDMVRLLLSNDLLVTLGGMTTYEAMCLGVAVSCVRWKYLAYIVKSFGEKNMANDLGDIENAYENMLNLDIGQVNNNIKHAFNIIDGSALKNIENIVNKYY